MREIRRLSCTWAKHHPGLRLPLIYSVVSNDSGSGCAGSSEPLLSLSCILDDTFSHCAALIISFFVAIFQ